MKNGLRLRYLVSLGVFSLLLPVCHAGVLSLDGADDWVELSNADGAIPSGNESFTIEAWVNPDVHGDSTMTFWGNQTGNQANGFRLRSGGNLRHYFWGNDNDQNIGDISDDASGPNGDGWHHLAVSFDGADGQWYWNGAPVGAAFNTGGGVNMADANHRIGSRINAEFFDGFLDEIRIWNVARSAENIAGSFDKQLDPATPGLVAYYQFEAADDFLDSTGSGHDGTAMGGATVDINMNAPVAPAVDSDADDLPDAWELRWATIDNLGALTGLEAGPGPGPGTGDFDGDGLTDLEELGLETDPAKADTDGDGVPDEAEVKTHGTDPRDSDSDGDGLPDGEEINTRSTDPLDSDSDDDFLSDGEEIAGGSDPNDAGSPGVKPGLGALSLDGTSHVTFANDSGLIPSGDEPFTIESWINPTSIPAGGLSGGQITFWGEQAGNQSNGFRLRGGGGVRHYFWGNDHDEDFGEDILPDTTGPQGDGWHHLAITYDGTQTIWYWNGIPLGLPRTVVGLNVADANHRIGSRIDAEYFDGFIDELRIWDVARTEAEIAENFVLALSPDTPGLVAYWDFTDLSLADITGNGHDGAPQNNAVVNGLLNSPVVPRIDQKLPMSVRGEGDNLVFTWPSRSGKLYNLRSEVDPSVAPDPVSWPIWDSHQAIAATPDENTLTIPRPADPTRYFVIEEYDAPPTTLYFENFEGGDGGWSTGGNTGDDPGTAWALGTPSNVGPDGAASGSFCFGTNVSDNYTNNVDIWLRSPVIDLTGQTEAFLSYFEAKDIEAFAGQAYDYGRISVLDAGDDTVIAVLLDEILDTNLEWGQAPRTPVALPAEALNKQIRLEFLFLADDFQPDPQAGWYIDDVLITD